MPGQVVVDHISRHTFLCCVVLWVTRTWKLLFMFYIPTFKITKADVIEERAHLLIYMEQLTRIWLNAKKHQGLGLV